MTTAAWREGSLSPPASAALVAGGCVALALGVGAAAAWQAPETALSPITPPGVWSPAYAAALAGAFLFYLVGLWVARAVPLPARHAYAVAAVIQLVPLAAPLLLSRDVYAYWVYGRIDGVHGANPYVEPPAAFPGDPAGRLIGNDWRETVAVYGPVFVLVARLIAVAAGDSPDVAVWLFRGVAAASALAVVALAGALAVRSSFAVAFVGWNPLLALHFAGGGHNDALMLVLVLGALLAARRGRRQLGGALWPVAVAVKSAAAVFLPLHLLACERTRRFGWKGFVSGLLAVVVLALGLYRTAWFEAAAALTNQATRMSSVSVPYWVAQLGVSWRIVAAVLSLTFAVVYAWLLVEAWRGRARFGLAAGAFAVTLSWLMPWYAAWAVALAAVEEDRTARWLALVLSLYLGLDALPLR